MLDNDFSFFSLGRVDKATRACAKTHPSKPLPWRDEVFDINRVDPDRPYDVGAFSSLQDRDYMAMNVSSKPRFGKDNNRHVNLVYIDYKKNQASLCAQKKALGPTDTGDRKC